MGLIMKCDLQMKAAAWFPQPLPSTWLGFCRRSAPSCPSLEPLRSEAQGFRTVTRPTLGDRPTPSSPPLLPVCTKTKGTIVVRNQLPERAQVSFSSGSELIPLWLGNRRGGWGRGGQKVGQCEASILKKTDGPNLRWYQVLLSGRHCQVIRIWTAARVSHCEFAARNHSTLQMIVLI